MKISIKDAAALLGMAQQTLRIGLQRGLFPFGVAIPTSKNRYTYNITKERLDKYIKGEL